MSHLPSLVTDLALILIFAGVITLIFKWLKQPLVLGYIVAGILAGPFVHFLPSVIEEESIKIWADIGVVFLMFGLGLEFSLKKLMQVGVSALTTAIIVITAVTVIGFSIGFFLGWSKLECLFLGCMMSMSSTAIIVKAFSDLGLNSKRFTSVVFGALVIEDLFAILLLVLLPTISVSDDFSGMTVAATLLKVVFFFTLWFVVGIYVIPIFLKQIKKIVNNEMMLIISMALCLGMVVLASYTGFSAALGAFVMGSILASTIEAEHIEHLVEPVKDLFGAVFFVSIGMMLDPNILREYAGTIALITIGTIVGQSTFASMGVLLSGKTLKTSIQAGFSFSQIGEFSFIIASLGLSVGAISGFIYPVIIAVSVITTFTTPYMIRAAEPFSNWFYKILPQKTKDGLDRYASGSKTINHDSDWKKLLQDFFSRWIIYVVLLVAIYLLSTQFIRPFVIERVEGVWASLICVVVTLGLMSPFLTALIVNRFHSQELFMTLWKDSKFNRGRMVSLVLLRVATAGFFMVMVLLRYLHFGSWEGIIVSVIILLLILFFRRDLSSYIKLEQRFISNLNQRESEQNQQSVLTNSFSNHLNDRDIHLSAVVVPADSPFVGKSLMELSFRKNYGVSIVKIYRGDRRINIPDKEERIYPQDKLIIVGTDEQTEHFWEKLASHRQIEQAADDKEVSLQSFEVGENFPYIGQTIQESGIGSKYKCLIVGLERQGLSLMNPDNSITFMVGDLVWLVGEEDVIKTMVETL